MVTKSIAPSPLRHSLFEDAYAFFDEMLISLGSSAGKLENAAPGKEAAEFKAEAWSASCLWT